MSTQRWRVIAEASPTEDLVSAYEMADGREFSWSDPTMKANPYVGREPRFYASILYNGAPLKGQTLYTYEGCNDGYALERWYYLYWLLYAQVV